MGKSTKVAYFLGLILYHYQFDIWASYPTSNLYFMKIASIELKLNEYETSKDDVIKMMTLTMKVIFDKFWHEYCVILAFGCVLDPREKFPF